MTRVKICGLTNLEDALVAIAAGADLLGFVFYAKSPRGVTAAQAAPIIQEIRRRPYGQGAVQIVGLFVDAPLHEMQETIHACQLDLVQLHGGEPPHRLEQLAPRAFKALRPTSLDEAAAEAEWYADLGPPAGPQLLLDAFHPQLYGGSGRLGDWALAAGLGLLAAARKTEKSVAGPEEAPPQAVAEKQPAEEHTADDAQPPKPPQPARAATMGRGPLSV